MGHIREDVSHLYLPSIPLGFIRKRAFIPLGFIKIWGLLVNKGGLAEMVLGWEMIKYNNPRSQHDLYYWENTAEGTRSEVDYIIARDLKVLPIECKAGVSGKMKSLHLFMRQKHLTNAIRCSLENFALLENRDKQQADTIRRIQIIPLYAISNLYK